MTLDELLRAMVAKRASDLHLQASSPPTGRVAGVLIPFGGGILMRKDTMTLARSLPSADKSEDCE